MRALDDVVRLDEPMTTTTHAPEGSPAKPPPSPVLTTLELSQRWHGTPTPETLRNWRVLGKGPQFEVRQDESGRHVVYPLPAIQAYELAHSSIPRKRAWKGQFLTVEELLERWQGSPNQVTESALREWRSERGRRHGLSYVLVHPRQALYPIEAVRLFEDEKADERRARDRARADHVNANNTSTKTFGQLLVEGPPTDD